MSMNVQEVGGGKPTNLTATATISAGGGALKGFYVNSTTAGTIVLYDATSATNAISGTITPAIGYHAFPAKFSTGLHAVIANTLDVTFFTT